MGKPLILVTNDDGVYAPGIRALHEAVSSLGEAIIVAPERDNSAVSHSLTMNRPLRVVPGCPAREVTIRITAQDEGSRIDLRSASRAGVSDLGVNAKRIRAFTNQFTTPQTK